MSEASFNKSVRDWASGAHKALEGEMDSLGIEHRDNSPSPVASRDALKHFTSSKFGLVSAVSFKFPRHMVFVQKGVGKGRAKGSGKERPKDWFNGPMAKLVEDLADKVADETADLVVGKLMIR